MSEWKRYKEWIQKNLNVECIPKLSDSYCESSHKCFIVKNGGKSNNYYYFLQAIIRLYISWSILISIIRWRPKAHQKEYKTINPNFHQSSSNNCFVVKCNVSKQSKQQDEFLKQALNSQGVLKAWCIKRKTKNIF